MSDEARRRIGRVLVPLAVVIGILAAVTGTWWTVAAMVLVAISQALNLRSLRRRHDGGDPRF